MMRKKLCIFLSIVIFTAMITSNSAFTAEREKQTFEAKPEGIELDSNIEDYNIKGEPLNWYAYTQYNVVVYGNPKAMKDYNVLNEVKYITNEFAADGNGFMWDGKGWGEYRFLGFRYDGGNFTNDRYHGITETPMFTNEYRYNWSGLATPPDTKLIKNKEFLVARLSWRDLNNNHPQYENITEKILNTDFYDDDHPNRETNALTGYTLNDLLLNRISGHATNPDNLDFKDVLLIQSEPKIEDGNMIFSIRYNIQWDKSETEVHTNYNTVDVTLPIAPPTPTPSPTPSPSPSPTPAIPPDASTGRLRADVRAFNGDGSYNESKELYNVADGIPSTEKLYTNIRTPDYLREYTYHEESHTVSHIITVQKTYNLSWWEDNGGLVECTKCEGGSVPDPMDPTKTIDCTDCKGSGKVHESDWVSCSDTVDVSKSYDVSRDYSYWKIDRLQIHAIVRAEIENDALGNSSVPVLVNEGQYNRPGVVCNQAGGIITNPFDYAIDQGIITAGYTLQLSDESLSGSSSRPDVDTDPDWESTAEAAIGEFSVKNDLFEFDANTNDATNSILTVMSATLSITDAPDPGTLPAVVPNTNLEVLYKPSMDIPVKTTNDVYETEGRVIYQRLPASVNPSGPATVTRELQNVNSVKVHTPVVCNSGVRNEIAYSQKTGGGVANCSELVLGRYSQIKFQTDDLDTTLPNMHLDIKGYGKRNYTDYTAKKYVLFPFDIYIKEASGNMAYLKKNTWYEVAKDKTLLDVYIPVWVDEGNYTVRFKAVVINAEDDLINDPAASGNQQNLANKDPNNYVAYRDSKVRVVGQVYNFRITDVHDYPLWESVFRAKEGSFIHRGKAFTVGGYSSAYDSHILTGGRSATYDLPIMEGSNPAQKDHGALKTGYGFKFELNTIGEYFGDDDYIRIKPSFFYVNKDGTGRTPVDIYYSERFDGKENIMVRIGSDKDKQNKKLVVNTNLFRNIPEEDIQRTEDLTGKSFREKEVDIGTFAEIQLNKDMRVFTGNTAAHPFPVNSDEAKRVIQSMQRWYGEYYLPDKLYVVPSTMTENDIVNHSETQDGIDGSESFWLKDGYIIVNFEIETIQNGSYSTPELNYYNAMYNRWQAEGFDYSQTDFYSKSFQLENGDIVFYYAGKKASDDYKVGGNR